MANLSSFDLNLLRILDALLSEGSTVRAAQRVGLSQPAVSAALGRLRAALNDPLLVRHGQRLEPTDYALSLAVPLRNILDSLQTLISGPAHFDPARAINTFKISGSDFFAEMLMPALGEQFARIAPGVRVQLVDQVPDDSLHALESSEIDLALMPKPECPTWIDWHPLFNSSLTMIARKGNSDLRAAGLSVGDIVPIDLFCDLGQIVFSPQGRLKTMGDATLAKIGRTRRVVMTLPTFAGVCSVVAASDQVALLPQQFAHRIATKLPIDVYQPPVPMPLPLIGMIWHKRATHAPAHRWLRDRIADLLQPLNEKEPPLPPETESPRS